MLRQIDQFCGFAHAANCRFLHRFAFSGQCDDAAVMVGVHLAIEQIYAIEFHGLDDAIDFGLIPSFRKIRDALHQRLHKPEAYLEGNAAATRRGKSIRWIEGNSYFHLRAGARRRVAPVSNRVHGRLRENRITSQTS